MRAGYASLIEKKGYTVLLTFLLIIINCGRVISQTQDTTAANLVTFDYSPKSVNVGSSAQDVTFTLRITDDLSGFGNGSIQLLSPSRNQGGSTGISGPISGTINDGIYQGTITIPRFAETGTWHVFKVAFRDVVGNWHDYFEPELASLGFPTELTVGICQLIFSNPSTLSDGKVGVFYSQSLSASGGTAPYKFAVTAGSLPSGVTLSDGGVFSGTPIAPGTFTFTVTTTDAQGCTVTTSYTVTITTCSGIILAPTKLPNGKAGRVYNQALTVSGGTAPHNFALTAGSLPNGLTLSTSGAISGTPTTVGTLNFTVTATDAQGCTGNTSYSIRITP